MSPPFPQIVGYDEATWEMLGGQGRRMNDYATPNFVATMKLDRSWVVTVIDDDDTAPDSPAAWWNDHCDDGERELVRGALPFEVIAGKRAMATKHLMRVQKEYDTWLACGCPMVDAA